MEKALERETHAVESLYSTKPVRVIFGAREYRVPANYFDPKGKNMPDVFDAGKVGYFGLRLFLPDFGGYTVENWRDKFDRRLIQVVQIRMVDKDQIVRFTDGRTVRISPAGYGEPKAQFENARPGLEEHSSFQVYDLRGYRPKFSRVNVTWTGTRSNGEFVFFRCHLAPGDPPQVGIVNPLCDVRYYSEKEDLYIAYRYSNDHLDRWREIDDAIWSKLSAWRVR